MTWILSGILAGLIAGLMMGIVAEIGLALGIGKSSVVQIDGTFVLKTLRLKDDKRWSIF